MLRQLSIYALLSVMLAASIWLLFHTIPETSAIAFIIYALCVWIYIDRKEGRK